MELKANGIGGEGAAGQPRPFDRALSFFDPLLTCPALIIESDNAFSGPRQVGDDKSDARVQLAWMPFYLGYDMARPIAAEEIRMGLRAPLAGSMARMLRYICSGNRLELSGSRQRAEFCVRIVRSVCRL